MPGKCSCAAHVLSYLRCFGHATRSSLSSGEWLLRESRSILPAVKWFVLRSDVQPDFMASVLPGIKPRDLLDRHDVWIPPFSLKGAGQVATAAPPFYSELSSIGPLAHGSGARFCGADMGAHHTNASMSTLASCISVRTGVGAHAELVSYSTSVAESKRSLSGEEDAREGYQKAEETKIFARGVAAGAGAEAEQGVGEEDGSLAARTRQRQRFFKVARVVTEEEHPPGSLGRATKFAVLLDGHALKTPSKHPFSLPTEALAWAIAAEWEWQEGKQLRPFTMPMMKLAATAVDIVPKDRMRIIETLLRFFHSDSVLCRDEPGSPLFEKQAQAWDPLLAWARAELGVILTTSSDLHVPDQSEATIQTMRNILMSLSDWELSAVDALASAARSLVIALAVAHGQLSIDDALMVIRLDEDHQVEEWGYVEGGHDIDEADLHVRVASASLFMRLLQFDWSRHPTD
eukprot:TRINITY_DN14767_c1_g2_i1.p1 TRINITY_DN14767_c1_g2~~TRINITY_DN14767_c1_g2_i1.p1  ORF type:complete len:460 (-),score=94.81 TRINITY_DN14767_c1_g2_i1:372-1751(-)